MLPCKPIIKRISLFLVTLVALFLNTETAAQDGKALYQANCQACHALDKNLTGPALRGFLERGPWGDREELYKWIHNPAAYIATNEYANQLKNQYGSIMQAFPQLTNEEIDAIADYVANAPMPGGGTAAPGDPAAALGLLRETLELLHALKEQYPANREIGPDLHATRLAMADTLIAAGRTDVLRTDVISNLIGNALKFTPPGGEIRVVIRPDGDRVSFEVADTGCGIPQDQLDHIFEKYYQGRGSTGGAGLGLAIAKAGAEAHGGRIDVTSRVGRGTRCRVSLPLRAVSTPIPHVRAGVG